MRRFNTFLFVVVIIAVTVGLSRGWFVFSGGREAGRNKVDVNLTIDGDKLKTDAETVKQKTEELTGTAAPTVSGHSPPAPENAFPNK